MSSCHRGNADGYPATRFAAALVLCLCLPPATHCGGQSPADPGRRTSEEADAIRSDGGGEPTRGATADTVDAEASGSAPDDARILTLDTYDFDNIKEGYVGLEWNEVEGAFEYEVIEDTGAVYYRGALPQAFISGLSNGTHYFSVRAVNEAGDVLASTDRPVSISVEHWPLNYGVISFGVGLIVVLSIIGAIVYGALTTRRAP